MSARDPMLRTITTLVLTLAWGGLTACASVPPAVKDLVKMQADKTAQTVNDAANLATDTDKKVKAFQDSLEQLDLALQAVQAEEAKYALVFSSNQNLETKSGVDATAAAYRVAEIYLDDQAGLAGSVKDQFSASEVALQELAKDWTASWLKIQATQKIISDYSEKSAVAAIDPNFVAAVAAEAPGGAERLDSLLSSMKDLKQAIDRASSAGLGKVKAVGKARSVTGDLVDLLEAINKSKPAK